MTALSRRLLCCAFIGIMAGCVTHAYAQDTTDSPTTTVTSETRGHRLLDFIKLRREKNAQSDADSKIDTTPQGTQEIMTEEFQGRDIDIYMPAQVKPEGKRALLVILHGGGGNSSNVRKSLMMDHSADTYGFVIAYLNGTRAGTMIPDKMRTWNAGGGCCGLSYKNNVDDITYISEAVHYLTQKYAIDPHRVFGMGHSNGAMMTQRLMCETDLYAAAVPVSGILNTDTTSCPAAQGKRILAIHGAMDENVPVAGGTGTKGVTNINYNSEAHSQDVFQKSGATYTVDLVRDADHYPANIRADMVKYEGISMGDKVVQFLGLDHN